MSDAPEERESIAGERDAPIMARPSSLTSRINNVLALGLMSALGLGMLIWYYTHSATKAESSHERRARATRPLAADVPLPSLGTIDAPPPPPPSDLPPHAVSAATRLPEVPLEPNSAPNAGSSAPKSIEDVVRDRKLSGGVYAAQGAPQLSSGVNPGAAPSMPPGGADGGELSALLKSNASTASAARMLRSQRLLLPKGAFIDCTLETAIDSTLPGMTSCVLATDTFGADGDVVLLERGTKLVGETRGQVQQGSARVFVIWTEARTPEGVVVPLDSPGADELGRSGLPGVVNRHFLQRFGAAMLISMIDGAISGAVGSSRSGTVIVDPAGTQAVTTEALRSTVNIPPTISKKQGDRIQVLVARDVDFRSVYELVPAAAGR